MKLQHFFAIFPGLPEDKLSLLEVTGLYQDARQVIPGSVFVAIKGQKFDGHDFLSEAAQKGATALVVEDKNKVPDFYQGFVLSVPDSRKTLDLLASRFYWNPGQELFCIGVTGTNGKTSITYMLESIFNFAGHKTAVMGTVNHHLGGQVFPSSMTTPDPISLQKRLREFREMGATALALEVSSHALEQKRADSVAFNVAIFTNLSRDHLDYHPSLKHYFQSKQRLFTEVLPGSGKHPQFAVVNVEDSWGRCLQVDESTELITYGKKDADLMYKILHVDFASTRFCLMSAEGDFEILLPMCGAHNVMNALAASGAARAAGIKWSSIKEGLEKFTGVPGRLQLVPSSSGKTVLVDYAHSPDAIENVLRALQDVRTQAQSKAKIHVVFGCGGDRDKGKRPQMAQVALRGADFISVTSDNPRTENPQAIVDDIVAGVPSSEMSRVRVIVDRAQAIRQTIESATEGDVILIAGKGHEDYQIIGEEKFPFSDYDIALQSLQELK